MAMSNVRPYETSSDFRAAAHPATRSAVVEATCQEATAALGSLKVLRILFCSLYFM
jgi:hypothetical protein